MSSSDITVAALTATPTLRGNKCAWTYSDPRANALPNIGLDMVEVWASTTNDRTTAAKVGEGITDFTHAGLVEEQTWYYWIKARDYLGSFGVWHPSGSTSGVLAISIGMSGIILGLANGKLVTDINSTDAAVAVNTLRIKIQTAAGNDPSVNDPVYVAFRSTSLSAGNYTIISITSALSLTLHAGSTMAGKVGTQFRIWVVLFNDSGTLRLGVINCSDGVSTIYPLPANATAFATIETTPATVAGTIYANANIGGRSPFRIIGYMEWLTGFPSVAGNWQSLPGVIRAFGPGVPTPGDVVQDYSQRDPLARAMSTIIPLDDTLPQNTEGQQLFVATITNDSICNLIEVEVIINASHSVVGAVIASLFRDSDTDATTSSWEQVSPVDAVVQLRIRDRLPIRLGSSSQFRVRCGPAVAGTMTLNGISSGRILGGSLVNFLRLTEIMG